MKYIIYRFVGIKVFKGAKIHGPEYNADRKDFNNSGYFYRT